MPLPHTQPSGCYSLRRRVGLRHGEAGIYQRYVRNCAHFLGNRLYLQCTSFSRHEFIKGIVRECAHFLGNILCLQSFPVPSSMSFAGVFSFLQAWVSRLSLSVCLCLLKLIEGISMSSSTFHWICSLGTSSFSNDHICWCGAKNIYYQWLWNIFRGLAKARCCRHWCWD